MCLHKSQEGQKHEDSRAKVRFHIQWSKGVPKTQARGVVGQYVSRQTAIPPIYEKMQRLRTGWWCPDLSVMFQDTCFFVLDTWCLWFWRVHGAILLSYLGPRALCPQAPSVFLNSKPFGAIVLLVV